MTKEPRKPTPRLTELSVLDQSRRRCALCFYFKGDLAEKLGQIAHLDDNPANFAEDNLAFLCMDHHSVYDSTTSQHKNYTIDEAKAARNRLYQAIRENRHINHGPVVRPGREADQKILADLIQLMDETGTMRFLRDANFTAPFSWKQLEGLHRYVADANGAEYEFVDTGLEALPKNVLAIGTVFLNSLACNTWPTHSPGYNAIPEEWEDEQHKRFKAAVEELHIGADKLCAAYDELIRTARGTLLR
jgi:hypothetical protein